MKCAAVCILVCLALVSPAFALLRPLFPVKAAPPFSGDVIVVGDDSVRDPTNLIECGSRDELKGLGEGQKITVVAWALTAKKGGPESCNCDLPNQADVDNHIVLIDPRVKNPTLGKDEIRSVTAEFTPRVRLDHPNFTRTKLNHLIAPTGKLLVRVTGLLLFDSKHFFHDSPPCCETQIGRYTPF